MAISRALRRGLVALALAAREGADLEQVFRGFDERALGTGELIDASEPRRNEMLESVLAAIARRVHGSAAELELLVPMGFLAELRFWHGAVAAGGWMALFFYFEEHDVGVAAFARGARTEYVRFAIRRA